jgi:type II secretory pathway pseudopilin PulG
MSKGGDNGRRFTPLAGQRSRRRAGSLGVRPAGFTIVETMIVLVVSAGLAVSAMLLVNGRQNKTQFQVAINSLQQQVQQIINETASGYYPGGNFTCQANALSYPTLTGVVAAQGTNGDCIFIGKALRLGAGSNAANNVDFTVYPMIANRLDSAGKEQSDPSTIHPTVVAPGALTNTSSVPDNSTTYQLRSGLTFGWQRYRVATSGAYAPTFTYSANTTLMVFVNSLAPYPSGGGQLLSGDQQLSLYGSTGFATPPASSKDVVDRINTTTGASAYVLVKIDSLRLCFNSGGTNQAGIMNIGNNGGLSVHMEIKDGQCASLT